MKKYNSVLVVDDNPIDVLLHKKLLEKTNLIDTVCTATSAQSGIEYIQNLMALGDKNLIPSYIFLDLDMPLGDGFQFLQDLENLKISTGILKGVIVLSAGGFNIDTVELKQSRLFLDFIQKPLMAGHLTGL